MSQRQRNGGFTRLAAAVAGLLMLAPACGFGEGGASSQPMRLTVLKGPASLVHEAKSRPVTGSVDVAAGDSIVMGKGSRAKLNLEQGRELELQAARLSIVDPTTVKLSGGEVLSIVSKRMTIDAESVVVEAAKGAFRVDKALATRVANYGAGAVKVSGIADELEVPAFRQATVAGGIVPRAPKPIQIDAKDDWDQRYLQDAIDLDGRLANFARGLEAQLGSGAGIEFFQAVAPIGAELSFLGGYLTNRRSDLLIGLILSAQANAAGADLPQRFVRIYDLWSQGATWGLLAHEFSVGQEGVFARLLEAIQKAGIFSPTGAGPGLNRRTSTSRPTRRPSQLPSPTSSQSGSAPPPPPPTDPCTQDPQPPDCIVPGIIDDLFSGQSVENEGVLGLPLP